MMPMSELIFRSFWRISSAVMPGMLTSVMMASGFSFASGSAASLEGFEVAVAP